MPGSPPMRTSRPLPPRRVIHGGVQVFELTVATDESAAALGCAEGPRTPPFRQPDIACHRHARPSISRSWCSRRSALPIGRLPEGVPCALHGRSVVPHALGVTAADNTGRDRRRTKSMSQITQDRRRSSPRTSDESLRTCDHCQPGADRRVHRRWPSCSRGPWRRSQRGREARTSLTDGFLPGAIGGARRSAVRNRPGAGRWLGGRLVGPSACSPECGSRRVGGRAGRRHRRHAARESATAGRPGWSRRLRVRATSSSDGWESSLFK